MSSIKRLDKSNSVTVFVVISIILIIGLVGAASAVKRRGQQVRTDQAIAVSEQQKADQTVVEPENPNSPEVVTSSGENSSASSVIPTTGGNSGVLPVTGPELNVVQMVGVGLLTALAVSYIRSRRNLISYL